MKKFIIIFLPIIITLTIFTFLLNAGSQDLVFSRTLTKNSAGNDVKELQNKLIDLGFYLGKSAADGYFGNYTFDAVEGVQSAKGLAVNGKTDQATINAINDLSKLSGKIDVAHFKQSDFKCKCCGKLPPNGIKTSLLLRLESLRAKCGNEKISITSGYRCPSHNASVGGVSSSQHIQGTAADIVISSTSPSTAASKAETIFENGGLGRYKTFIHVDVRGYKSRW